MGAHAAALFGPGSKALTHCNAGGLATGGYGSAIGALRAAWEDGLLTHVWVDETRPLLQGSRLTAWELEQLGIPHAVIADSAAAHLMSLGEVDCIVTGADRIAANGDSANKIGTYGLAVAAAHHRIPLYVVAPTSTIDLATATGAGIPIEERDGAEITARFPARNPAFDVTPAALIAAIVTEEGVHRPPYETVAAAMSVLDELVGEVAADPESIGLILHGSHAAGVDGPDSDYDLVRVVTDEGTRHCASATSSSSGVRGHRRRTSRTPHPSGCGFAPSRRMATRRCTSPPGSWPTRTERSLHSSRRSSRTQVRAPGTSSTSSTTAI